ncbi:MBL fold metallo-hydrolase [Candidatus Bipolaricaulota bacterium]
MRKGLAGLLLVVVIAFAAGAAGMLDVYFIDVGQGDAILIDYGEFEMLIDGGPDGSCVPFIQEYVDGSLEVVVATHPHSDHIGGLDDVLRAFDVLEVVTNGATATTNAYANFAAAVAVERCTSTIARRNDLITLGDLDLQVLHPHELVGDANDDSIVLLLSYGDVGFLFTGDITCDVEEELLREACLSDIDVLKVAHHGSAYGTCEAFLEVTKPEIAVYSAGVGNRYEHPADSTLSRLVGAGALILGTDKQGNIAISTTGDIPQISVGSDVPQASSAVPQAATACEACLRALNQATKLGFDAIPGIGDSKSQALVDSQPFVVEVCSIQEIEAVLDDVSGIGETLCERIARYFCPQLYGD